LSRENLTIEVLPTLPTLQIRRLVGDSTSPNSSTRPLPPDEPNGPVGMHDLPSDDQYRRSAIPYTPFRWSLRSHPTNGIGMQIRTQNATLAHRPCPWVTEHHILLHVRSHLPHVAGVASRIYRLRKIQAILIVLVQLLSWELPRNASSIPAENEHHASIRGPMRVRPRRFFQRTQPEVRRGIAQL